MRFLSRRPQEIGRRPIMVEGEPGFVDATVYDRNALPEGFSFAGPAIVQQSDTTTLVEPGWSCMVDGAGNLIVARREG